jgi:hypothetical protein
MAKMDLNEFVGSHKSGHGVGIRSLVKLKVLDSDGKKPAPVRSILLKTIGAAVTNDWSVTTTPSKTKIGGKTLSGTAYHFIFETTEDQATAIKAIGAQYHKTASKPQKPFATYEHLGDLTPVGYERLAKALPKPNLPKST